MLMTLKDIVFIGKWERTITGFTKSEHGVKLMGAVGNARSYR